MQQPEITATEEGLTVLQVLIAQAELLRILTTAIHEIPAEARRLRVKETMYITRVHVLAVITLLLMVVRQVVIRRHVPRGATADRLPAHLHITAHRPEASLITLRLQEAAALTVHQEVSRTVRLREATILTASQVTVLLQDLVHQVTARQVLAAEVVEHVLHHVDQDNLVYSL